MDKGDFKEYSYWLWSIPSSVIAFFAISYFSNFSENWDTNVVSVPTFLLEIVKIPFYLIFGSISIYYFYSVIIVGLSNIPLLITGLKELPAKITSEIGLIKEIWNNRGFGKYTLFGGIGFYIKLRLRVLAFFFAFLFFASISYFLYVQYRDYEPTHWIEKVYQNSEPKIFKFKKNVPYTVDLHGAAIEYFYVNGNFFCAPKSPLMGRPNFYALRNFQLHNKFHITFPEETSFAILLRTEMVVNDIISNKLEIWANKEEGVEYHYTVFDPRMYIEKNQ